MYTFGRASSFVIIKFYNYIKTRMKIFICCFMYETYDESKSHLNVFQTKYPSFVDMSRSSSVSLRCNFSCDQLTSGSNLSQCYELSRIQLP